MGKLGKTKLKKTIVNRVDLVDAGANPDAHILFFKAEDGEDIEAVGEEPEDFWKKDYPREKRIELARAGKAIPVLNDKNEIVNGRYPINDTEDLGDAARAIGRVKEGDRPKVAALARRQSTALGVATPDAFTKELATLRDDSTKEGEISVPENEDVAERIAKLETDLATAQTALKTAEDAQAAAVTKREAEAATNELLAKRIEDNETQIEKMRVEAADREGIAKAKGYTHLPIEAEKFGPVLRELGEKLSPEAVTEIDRVLTAANEGLSKSKAFAAVGSDEQGATEPEAQLDGLAKEYAKENKVSFAKAMTAVLETDEGRAIYAENHSTFVKSVGGER